jgi:DNA polymerase-3 subunit alpha (Gram-positive type)
MFSCCADDAELYKILDDAVVVDAKVNRAKGEMYLDVEFPELPAPVIVEMAQAGIAQEFGLSRVYIKTFLSAAAVKAKEPSKKLPRMLFGKSIREKSIPISDVTPDIGRCVVTGEVFGLETRDVRNGTMKIIDFNITDLTGSLHVSCFLRPDEEDKRGLEEIADGMYLTVRGGVSYNRWYGDISMEPNAARQEEKPSRADPYPGEKRVELHLHTRFSALDALTDPVAAIKLAAKWGHKAIAITDHGVAQAFPDAWNAEKGLDIKVIYGLEGYYVNDLDSTLAFHGSSDAPIDGEYVAFDIETTGLDWKTERITEIGAVVMKDGKELERFQTFVQPGKPIPPEITKLTGITDADVADAPDEAAAVADFLRFAGARPLVAHNAVFDVGFISAACARSGLAFSPDYIDTVIISRALLPTLKRHNLDVVADHLGLPKFNHHRASDDAVTCGLIYAKFIPKLRAEGISSLAQLSEKTHALAEKSRRPRHPYHIILLVKNKVGLKNLYELISKSHLEHFQKYPIIPKSLLVKHREGLIIGSACEAGEVFSAVRSHRSREELLRLSDFYDYLEIQPLCNNRFMVDNGTVANDEALREMNRRVVEIADALGKMTVATGDVHFLNPEDEIFRRILMANKYSDADRPLPLYFKTTAEMMDEFSYFGARAKELVIDNPAKIADMCEKIELLPKDLYTPKIENSAEDLQKLCYEKMHRLYGDEPPEVVKSRLETELHDILDRRYDVIYMSAQKLVADSLEHGYLVGSRGSVGSSLVAYMSGITEVNSLPPHYRCPQCRYSDFTNETGAGCGADMPDKTCPVCGAPLEKDGFDIPFETFLGFGGDKVPDIDLNFSGEYQANAHKYTETLFGRDHVFKAGTIGTLAEKTAFGYVKKYLAERGMIVTKAEENRLAAGCVGVKRTTGQHPGGLVIIPQDMDVTDFCPVQHPADDSGSDIITTHFDYHKMEANLLKLDELGHDDPTMIRMLEDLTGLDAKKIKLDDPETMAIFKSPAPLGLPEDDPIIGAVGTFGIPEFGTGFAQQMLCDIKPTQFNTLVRFVGFSHGTDVWLGNAKDLILSGTADVNQCVGCRDDIMLYLISLGMEPKKAFKIMEAVRKGKVKKSGFQDGWVEEMRDRGAPEWYIDSLAKIAYLFPKAHAVAYVMMAFRIAWFKVHYPLAFYSAYFYRRSQKDSFDAEIMTGGIEKVVAKINEIKRKPDATAKEDDLLTTLVSVYEFYMRGFSFAPIDLYESSALRFGLVGDKQLRPPFISISGLGVAAAEDLENCKKNGREFICIDDVAAACPRVSATHLEQLRAAGAFGDLPESAQLSLF